MDTVLRTGLTGGARTAHVEFGVDAAAIAIFSVMPRDIIGAVLFGVHRVARAFDFLPTIVFGVTFTGVLLSVQTKADPVQTTAVSVRLCTKDAEEVGIVASADGRFSDDVDFFTNADAASLSIMSHILVVTGTAGVHSVDPDADGVRRSVVVSSFAGVICITAVDEAVLRKSSMRFINSSVSSVGKYGKLVSPSEVIDWDTERSLADGASLEAKYLK